MKNMLLYLLLSAALTTPVWAQGAASTKRPKSPDSRAARRQGNHPAGEATSLEKKELGAGSEERETREDNHGRLTVAHRAKHRRQSIHAAKAANRGQVKVANVHSKRPAVQHAQNQPHRTAELKTGQLTTTDAARFQTRKTSSKHAVTSPRSHKIAPPDAEPPSQPDDQSPNRLRLKKHNARMF